MPNRESRGSGGGAIEQYHFAVEIRLRMYHGKAILYGEAAAQEWLSQQPPIGLDGGEPTP